MNRRDFLKTAAVAGLAAGAPGALASAAVGQGSSMDNSQRFKKGITLSMVAGDMSVADKFRVARDCGFHGVEVPPLQSPEAISEVVKAVEATGVAAHSIIFGGWNAPLSHQDPEVAARGLDELRAAIRAAKEIGADGVLLVPAVVNKEVSYADAYTRSQKNIRKAVGLAEALGININIEEVWNKFLLSPLEFARYVDELDSGRVQAYFDVGNVIDFGWPEQWIRTLGPRIHKIHLKDFKRDGRQWVPLGEGDADYPEVRRAMDEIGYSGWLTCELPAGDAAYLQEVSRGVDRIIAGQVPVAAG